MQYYFFLIPLGLFQLNIWSDYGPVDPIYGIKIILVLIISTQPRQRTLTMHGWARADTIILCKHIKQIGRWNSLKICELEENNFYRNRLRVVLTFNTRTLSFKEFSRTDELFVCKPRTDYVYYIMLSCYRENIRLCEVVCFWGTYCK